MRQVAADGSDLVLIGNADPADPRRTRGSGTWGSCTDEDKFDAMAAAELLVMPSYYESLSMVALEAWALGRPVLVNGRCDVLRGQCLRSNAGLYYEDYEEFVETLAVLEDAPPAAARPWAPTAGEYFRRHYAWSVIERKYLDMLERLERERSRRARHCAGRSRCRAGSRGAGATLPPAPACWRHFRPARWCPTAAADGTAGLPRGDRR